MNWKLESYRKTGFRPGFRVVLQIVSTEGRSEKDNGNYSMLGVL